MRLFHDAGFRMLEQLQKALTAAFTPLTLARMVKFKLDKEIDDYASPLADKQDTIYRLISAAQAEGFLNQLVSGARAFNPGNEQLHEFCREYGIVSTNKTTQALERLIDETKPGLNPVQLRQAIFDAETRVCRVEVKTPQGTIRGTGFLVSDDMVMTNFHVIEAVISGAVAPAAVSLMFDFKRNQASVVESGTAYKLTANWLVDASIPGPLDEPSATELDYAIVQLETTPKGVNDSRRGYYRILEQPPLAEGDALFIMQHPSGRAVELALDTNAVIGHNTSKTRVHYRTNTESGASGSPCFNPKFELVALHHSGDPNFDPQHKPTYNQGIPIAAIAALLRARGKSALMGVV